MSEGRRGRGTRTRQKAFDGQPSGPLVARNGLERRVRPVPQPHDVVARALRRRSCSRSLVLVFTALLSLPAATTTGKSAPLADAVFTAVSTICVTGLSTVDIATYFSPLRQGRHLRSASTSAAWAS